MQTHASRRKRRRRLGIVVVYGVETLGVDGYETQIITESCCQHCVGERNPALVHRGCTPHPGLARWLERGWIYFVRRDGEWRPQLTETGLEALTR